MIHNKNFGNEHGASHAHDRLLKDVYPELATLTVNVLRKNDMHTISDLRSYLHEAPGREYEYLLRLWGFGVGSRDNFLHVLSLHDETIESFVAS